MYPVQNRTRLNISLGSLLYTLIDIDFVLPDADRNGVMRHRCPMRSRFRRILQAVRVCHVYYRSLICHPN